MFDSSSFAVFAFDGDSFSLSDVEQAYPEVPASRSISLPSGGVWAVDPDVPSFCEIDLSAVLPSGVTLSSVSYTIPAGLTKADEMIDMDAGKCAVKIGGVSHAMTYQVAVLATLSNLDVIAITAPLRCFNG